MNTQRFHPLSDNEMTPEQRRVAQVLIDGPRRGLPGPFHALLRSPELADRVRQLGDYIRFSNSLPPNLCELIILLVARYWSAQFEWHAHRRLSREAGLDPSVADAIAEGRRPGVLSPDESLVYDFCGELLANKDVSDATYAAAISRFAERGVIDMVGTVGYFGLVAMVLNAERHPLPEGATPLPPLTNSVHSPS